MRTRDNIVFEARFDPKLKAYVVWQGVIFCVVTIVGLVALPFWIVLGRRLARRHYDALACVLTDRALVLRKGIWFRSESTVPLDRIQDVSVRHGPILDRLGLATMKVETAGMGSGQGSGINLTGVIDTTAFRDRVLSARDRAAGWDEGDADAALETATTAGGLPAGGDATSRELLVEIRDTLKKIDAKMAGRAAAAEIDR